MRVLITGSRNWTNPNIIQREIGRVVAPHDPREVTVVHGGAPGADTIAGQIAKEFGCHVEVHPADWDTHGKAAGPIRNVHMVSLGADICLAFPLGASRGTRGCMKLAREAGIPVVEYGAPA